MKNTLIIVSTHNRRDLTGITLDSLANAKSADSDVLIWDDASSEYEVSWLGRWGWPVARSSSRVGVGQAAYWRYKNFIDRPYTFLCVVDNDLLFADKFDSRLLEFYRTLRTAVPDKPLLVTGYRSVTQLARPGSLCFAGTSDNWESVDGAGGACQFSDRLTAESIIASVPEYEWDGTWDRSVSRACAAVYAPTRSLIQHLGIYGTGVNGISNDTAKDFVGTCP